MLARVSSLTTPMPATATVVGVVVLRQFPTAVEVLGVALVVVGVAAETYAKEHFSVVGQVAALLEAVDRLIV